MRLISEIRVTINDCRSNVLGGLAVGMEIFTKAVQPFLFNNCQVWTEIPKKAMHLLNSITHTFFRSLFQASKGNSLVMFFWDTGSLLNENFIILKKLLFWGHLTHLKDDALAKEVCSIQENNPFKGSFISECLSFLEVLDVKIKPSSVNKNQWSRLVKEKVHNKNKTDLLYLIRANRKLDVEKLCSEEYGMKSYLSSMRLSDGRTFFSARSMMLNTFQWNFKSNPEFRDNGFKCVCKEHIDSQSEVLNCRLYEHLKEGLDVYTSDLDLVKFFQLVTQERLKQLNI